MGEKDKVVALFDAKEVMPQERWASLVEDCKQIIVEHLTVSREAVIEMKWYLGDRLLEEGEQAITPLLQRVAEEIHIGERDLWYCFAFRKKFPRLEELWSQAPEGKNISWHKLVNHYIDFAVPKPELPVEEKNDTFGLLEWWAKQPDMHVLRLTCKGYDFGLIIKRDKEKIFIPEKQAHLKDVYKELGEYFVKLKKWDVADLNRNDYGRMNKALKELLEKANYDKEKVKRAIHWCYERYLGSKVDWTIETVVKKYAEAVRIVKPHEKYLERK